jgi:hypothetical protein
MRLPWFATALLITQGCATQHANFGHGSTDLSGLRAGVSRADVEKVTGAPEGLDAGDGAYVAYYVYDRGYVGTLEGQGTASKIVMVPVLAWGELLTLGLLGASLEH